ncbi:hypothetical protein [Vagococcus xieshaowenii]|uniref:Uncharacterized protein n=1 Tax=Vagococcus xieshaowenii TaxID=2562451 RepID=A0A4Z0DD16_9ENTE|nr:hypothetical protein [Vagococcus xieshaowenii]QCA28432.1 hypothetical protein E4Z98_03565 [Vagococcus xieshaowenii]TFZ42812.1 hypothetical protein E4031_02175 [Vagococcus xieshaowenii]
MSGLIWNILSTIIGGAIGGGTKKVAKNIPASGTANTAVGAIGGLIASLLQSGNVDVMSLLSTVIGGAGAPAILNILLKVLASKK